MFSTTTDILFIRFLLMLFSVCSKIEKGKSGTVPGVFDPETGTFSHEAVTKGSASFFVKNC
jgi:hypothetical protein